MPPKKILIADDDDNIRTSVRDILELEGYDAYDADNGEKTLVLYDQVHPDLIILDMMMPEMDGASLAFEINNRITAKKIPIIFISGMIAPDSAVNNTQAVYLSKPFSIEELLKQVRKGLGE